MKIIAVIPARLQATRFPEKLIQDLEGKPVLVRTYEAVVQTNLFDEVLVVTDADKIESILKNHGIQVIKSKKEHESGSDRIAEAVQDLEVDVVVNVQGDEPFIDIQALQKMVEAFRHDTNQQIDLCSLMTPILEEVEKINNPNVVKVVVDKFQKALYFSRAPIPFVRDHTVKVTHYQHIGVYGFRKQSLLDFAQWQPTLLEQTEKLEQLRYLERGKKIQMIETYHVGIGIDTPEDLEKARKIWKK
jgi:3-deoxy-manno-octulosonate cytidylyltransferase (CMP-KDO synthetase)